MALVFISKSDDPDAYTHSMQALMPDLEVRLWPDVGDPAEIDFALTWKAEPGVLASFPNLKAISSLGFGVDHLFDDDTLPEGVPLVRLAEETLTGQMSEYAILGILRHHRMLGGYETAQGEGRWARELPPDTGATSVGILGLGVIGADCAAKVCGLGFPVRGWSRSPRALPGVECFHGADGLAPMLAASHFLVCLLPLTPQTRGIVNAHTLAALPTGAYVINAARGGHVVDTDLLAAIESGHIAGAMLDVFNHEPLPRDHPYWAHPKITVTPHIAGLCVPRLMAPQIVENIRRVRAGRPLLNLVDRARGY
jgi:glyoxylate/hydroxypyruvate reductase A